jgi:hypothetical protein
MKWPDGYLLILGVGSSGVENSAGNAGTTTSILIRSGIIYNLFSGHWESTEDWKIASCILQKGSRWSEIAKTLGRQRT